MSEAPQMQMVEVELPEFYIMTDENVGTINLVATTSGSMAQYLLGKGSDYKRIASQFREMIMRAGAELASKSSGIVVVKELPDGLRKPQGR